MCVILPAAEQASTRQRRWLPSRHLLDEFNCQAQGCGNGVELRERHVVALFDRSDGGRRHVGDLADFVAGHAASSTCIMNSLRNAWWNRPCCDGFGGEVVLGPFPDYRR